MHPVCKVFPAAVKHGLPIGTLRVLLIARQPSVSAWSEADHKQTSVVMCCNSIGCMTGPGELQPLRCSAAGLEQLQMLYVPGFDCLLDL